MSWLREAWSETAATALGSALGADVAEIRLQVEQGVAVLWRIPDHGYMITRLESHGDRRELVLVAWSGKNTGPLIDHVQGICTAEGINSIRFHTQHAERLVTRFVQKWGFAPVETVYRWVA